MATDPHYLALEEDYKILDENVVCIENEYIKLGINVALGGAVTYLAEHGKKNLINAVTAENKILNEIITAATVVISLAVLQIFLNAGSNWVPQYKAFRTQQREVSEACAPLPSA